MILFILLTLNIDLLNSRYKFFFVNSIVLECLFLLFGDKMCPNLTEQFTLVAHTPFLEPVLIHY